MSVCLYPFPCCHLLVGFRRGGLLCQGISRGCKWCKKQCAGKEGLCDSKGDVVAKGENQRFKLKDRASDRGRVQASSNAVYAMLEKGVQGLSKAALTGFGTTNVSRGRSS